MRWLVAITIMCKVIRYTESYAIGVYNGGNKEITATVKIVPESGDYMDASSRSVTRVCLVESWG